MEDLQTNNNAKSELANVSIKDLFFKYLRFLPFFLISVAVLLFGAYFYIRYSTEIYMVRSTMLIKSENNTGRQDKFSELFMSTSTGNIQNEIEVLKSKPLMTRVVKALNLQVSYYAIGKIKSTNIYKASPFRFEIFELKDSSRTFSFKIRFIDDGKFALNQEKQTFAIGQLFRTSNGVFRLSAASPIPAEYEYEIRWQPMASVASGLASGINVQPKLPGGSGLLNISLETPNPQLGTDIVNQLMVEYSKRSVEEKNLMALQTIEFIDDRLKKLGRDIDSIQRGKLDYQQKNDLIDVEIQSTGFFSMLTETDKTINLQEERLNTVTLIDAYLKDKNTEHEPFKLVPSSLGIEDQTLTGLVTAYNIAQLERKGLIDGGTPADNPVIKQKEGQIEEIRRSLLENLQNIRDALTVQLKTEKEKSKQIQTQLKQMPERTRNLLEIERALEGKQTLFKFLAEKGEETAISRASTIPDSEIIDHAVAPVMPIKPDKRTIRLLAILIGLGIPALIIFLIELLNDKITTRYDIEKVTQAPVLGEVGHSFSKETALIVSSNNRGMVAEQFRIIRSNLQYVLGRIERPVILVTSSFSGEGKSFVSTNLGAVMALAGKKTIVLEFDIRKPKILAGLNLPKNAGITNFLLNKVSAEALPVKVPGYENFYVLPCGPVPPNPAEMLLDDKIAELFVFLKKNFDVILIDTAPVGMVSDAMTLSKFADCTLYMVRQGYTFKKQIMLIDELYTQARLPKISIIINDVKLKPGYGYYGYGRYGYGYGYGQGYYEEEKNPKKFADKLIDFFNPVLAWKKLAGKKRNFD